MCLQEELVESSKFRQEMAQAMKEQAAERAQK